VNLLADESLDREIVERLRRDGNAVRYVAEMDAGISDDAVIDLANRDNAILVTADKDFGELVFRQHRLTRGVILVRLAGLPGDRKAALVASLVATHQTRLTKAFTVITPGAVRIRAQQRL
jgi:predicted nuclease of predicted toxin-antitoxin system